MRKASMLVLGMLSVFSAHAHAQECSDFAPAPDEALQASSEPNVYGGPYEECVLSCEAGGATWIEFCSSLPPQLAAPCYALQFCGVTACLGWCYWQFTD